jgi:hypothetical protein
MAKVFVWSASSIFSFGHAALLINDKKGNYVSWWAVTGTNPRVIWGDQPGYGSGHLKEDVEDEKRPAETTVTISFLDENRMSDEWTGLKKGGTWNFFTTNCSTMVAKLLRTGGAILSPRCDEFFNDNLIWSPLNVREYVSRIISSQEVIKNGIRAGFKVQPETILRMGSDRYRYRQF